MLRSIMYGRDEIEYRLKFALRDTLAISVHPDRSVEVIAPTGLDEAEIDKTVRRRARWIVKQKRYFEQFIPRTPARRYLSGETHRYLGRQYRLKIVKAEETGVKLTRGRLFIATPRPNDTRKNRSLLMAWYADRSRVKLTERFDAMCRPFERMNITRPTLAIRALRRRWGSHSTNGRITLNRDLIRAPTPCIDYVITHELCHMIYADHGPAFYELLERLMPDWEQRKHRLERSMV